MSPELTNTFTTIVEIIVAIFGALVFTFWIAIGIWTFNDVRSRSRDWLTILLSVILVLVFPFVGWLFYIMVRPKHTLADQFDRALEEEALMREIEESLACTSCGVPVKGEWIYCPNCHSQLQHSCPGCGSLVRNEWQICVMCGVNQQAALSQQYADVAYKQPPDAAPRQVSEDDETMPYRPVQVAE